MYSSPYNRVHSPFVKSSPASSDRVQTPKRSAGLFNFSALRGRGTSKSGGKPMNLGNKIVLQAGLSNFVSKITNENGHCNEEKELSTDGLLPKNIKGFVPSSDKSYQNSTFPVKDNYMKVVENGVQQQNFKQLNGVHVYHPEMNGNLEVSDWNLIPQTNGDHVHPLTKGLATHINGNLENAIPSSVSGHGLYHNDIKFWAGIFGDMAKALDNIANELEPYYGH